MNEEWDSPGPGAVEGGGTASGSSSNSESLSSVYKDLTKASAAMLCSLSDSIMLLSYDTEWSHPPA